MNTHISTAISAMHVTGQLVAKLEAENKLLIDGTARQQKAIRTLSERNSALEAEANLANYNVEFLKRQGRKTRAVKRDIEKQLRKAQEATREAEALAATFAANTKSWAEEVQKLSNEVTALRKEKAAINAAIYRIKAQDELPFQFLTGEDRFRVTATQCRWPDAATEVEVKQLGIKLRIAPEHVRDLLAHEHMADQAVTSMAREMKLAIVSALRGETVTHEDIHKARVERAKQQDFYHYTPRDRLFF